MNTQGFSAALWIWIASQGRVTHSDIRKNFGPEEYSKTLRSRVKHMVEYGTLHKFEDGSLGVTASCRIPSGMILRDVLGAVQ